jgi:hypothetical protein
LDEQELSNYPNPNPDRDEQRFGKYAFKIHFYRLQPAPAGASKQAFQPVKYMLSNSLICKADFNNFTMIYKPVGDTTLKNKTHNTFNSNYLYVVNSPFPVISETTAIVPRKIKKATRAGKANRWPEINSSMFNH